MKDFGAVMRGLASTALERVFADEWVKLSDHDAKLIRQDFLEASEDNDVTASEYARRIGRGNLQAYADVMRVREKQGWDRDNKR